MNTLYKNLFLSLKACYIKILAGFVFLLVNYTLFAQAPIAGTKQATVGDIIEYYINTGNVFTARWEVTGGDIVVNSTGGGGIKVRWNQARGVLRVWYTVRVQPPQPGTPAEQQGFSSAEVCVRALAPPPQVLSRYPAFPNLNTFNPIPSGGKWYGNYISEDGTISPQIPAGDYTITYSPGECFAGGTTSASMNITICSPFSQPTTSQSQIYTCPGESHSVTAYSSQGTVFRWYLTSDGSGLPLFTGSTFAYAPPDDKPHDFYVCVLNQTCESTRTKVSFLPYPGDAITGSNSSCAPASGTVSVTTSNGIDKWEKSSNSGISWDEDKNAPKTSSYSYSNITQNVLIRAWVNKGICSIPSQAASLTINKSVGGKPVANYTINECKNIQGTITLGASKNGELKSWYVSNDSINWKSIGNADPISFNIKDTTKYYYAVVQYGNCAEALSEVLAIKAKAYAGAVKVLSQLNCHTASGTLELTSKYGEVARWERSDTPDQADSWKALPNSANVIYSFNDINQNTSFRAMVKLTNCADSAYSKVASLQISNPAIGVLAKGDLVAECHALPQKPATITGEFKLKEYSGTIVRWEKYDGTGSWKAIDSTSNKVSYIYKVIQTTKFRVRLSVNGCDDIYSGEATIYVNAAYKGEESLANATIKEYDGHSYITNGSIILSKGFKFYSNVCQAFSITINENYTLANSNENFVLSEAVKKEGVKNLEELNWLGATDKDSEYNYFDGLGRAMQNVTRKASPSQLDLVQPIKYDALGRVEYEYLAYVDSTKDGSYKEDFELKQREFYIKDNDAIANSLHPFSKQIFDGSPLNRVMEQGAPGTAWQPLPVEGGGKTTKIQYLTNDETDIKIWKVIDSLPVSNGNYRARQLTVDINIDERGFRTKTYANKLGQVILRKVEARDKNDTIWVQTYFIYNEFGKQSFILSPEGVKRLQGNPNEDFLKLWAYCYRYDNKKRLIAKRIPGADWVYMIYDEANRIRLTQDGTQRKKKEYSVMKYDNLSRPILTALWKDSLSRTRNQVQTLLNAESQWYEERTTLEQGYTFNKSFPSITVNNSLTITYYDDYSFLNKAYFDSTGYGYSSQLGNPNLNNTSVKGLVTGGKVKILKAGDVKWLRSVSYYDDKERLIQTIKENNINGRDRVTTLYDFIGKSKKTLHTHIGYGKTIVIEDGLIYDHFGRLLTRQQKVGNSTPVNLNQNTYNQIGNLIEKNLHGTSTGYLQSIDYRYNIRGWKTSINNSSLTTDGGLTNDDANDVFGMEIKYESGLILDPSKALYNGSITEVLWKTKNDNKLKGYSFAYDELNRLKEAQYKAFIDNSWANTENGRYNESVTGYDLNGNILALNRAGVNGYNIAYATHLFGAMDSLILEHQGNQLLYVKDKVPDVVMPTGFKPTDFSDGVTDPVVFDKNNATTHEYTYNENGNTLKDKNKGINSIEYNYLNLPQKIQLTDGRYLINTYEASGTKIRETIYGSDGKGIDSTDYVGGFEYKGGLLQQVMTGEGRLIPNGNNFTYEYFIKDHLGSVRAKVSSGTGGLQTSYSDYYPFGMQHGGITKVTTTTNNYLYQGKELQTDFDLGVYDFEARVYDPIVPRTWQPDPHSEKYYSYSSYSWAANNPLNFIDPTGRDIININGGVRFTGQDAVIALTALQQASKDNVRIHFVPEALTPKIYKNTLNAFKEGKPAVLHLDSKNITVVKQRRYDATKVIDTKPGYQRDEYPYASTLEGGLGATVKLVPKRENQIQSKQLRALYRTMNQGDAFLVLPVPKPKQPETVPQEVEQNTPQKTPDYTPIFPPIPTSIAPNRVPGLQPATPFFFFPIFIPPDFLPNQYEQPEG